MYRLHRAMLAYQDARGQADSVISALSPAAWYRNATDVVSSGGFASIWADYASSDKGLVLPGVAGNTASMPDSSANSLTDDFDLMLRLSVRDWTPAADVQLYCKEGELLLTLKTTGLLNLTIFTIEVDASTAAPVVSDGGTLWIRVTRDRSAGELKWYTGGSAVTPSWVQLGSTLTGKSTAAIPTTSAAITIGDRPASSAALAGIVYRVILTDGYDGAGATVFDADFSAQTIGAGSFTESSSNAATVTINASGAAPAHIGKARDLLQGTGTNQPAYAAGVFTFDGADNFMAVSYTANQPRTIYLVGKQVTWADSDHLINGVTANVAVYQNVITPQLAIYAGSSVAANTNLAVNTMGIICTVFNGASSSLRINNTAKTTGNAGVANPGGLTLAALNAGLGNHANLVVWEVIDFAAAHDDTTQDSVITALNNALTVF